MSTGLAGANYEKKYFTKQMPSAPGVLTGLSQLRFFGDRQYLFAEAGSKNALGRRERQ